VELILYAKEGLL